VQGLRLRRNDGGVGRDIHVRFARSQDYQLDELAKFIETVG
jgi:hypothetical protein